MIPNIKIPLTTFLQIIYLFDQIYIEDYRESDQQKYREVLYTLKKRESRLNCVTHTQESSKRKTMILAMTSEYNIFYRDVI
jgi:hypothetical protein